MMVNRVVPGLQQSGSEFGFSIPCYNSSLGMTNFYEKSLRYNVKKRIRVYRLIQKKEKKSLREIGSIKKLNIIINKMPQFFVHFCLY